MKKRILILLLILFVLLSGCLETKPKLNYQDVTVGEGTITLHRLTFGTDLGYALESAAAQDKPVFVDIRSESCGWCKKFEEETYTNNTAVSKLKENFILVSLDINKQKKETRNFGLVGTPTFVFLYPNGTEIRRIPGYIDTESFITIINQIIK